MTSHMTQMNLNAEDPKQGVNGHTPRSKDIEFWVGRTTKGKLVRFGLLIVLALLLAVAP